MKAKMEFKRKVVLSIVFLVAFMGIFSFIGTGPLYAESTQTADSSGGTQCWALLRLQSLSVSEQ